MYDGGDNSSRPSVTKVKTKSGLICYDPEFEIGYQVIDGESFINSN